MTWKRPPPRQAKQIGGNIGPRATVVVPVIDSPPPVVTEKAEILRSESYRRYVSQFSCMRCGRAGPSQCAHANEGKGLALKVCDRRTFPLCPACHEELDNSRGMTRDQRRATEREFVAAMQRQARVDGREEIPVESH